MNEVANNTPAENELKPGNHWKLQFGILCGMLLLAMVGMGLTQAMESGAWEYWLVVVVIYAGLGLWRSLSKAKAVGKPLSPLIVRSLAHWLILLVFFGVLILLERKEIINRESSSDVALMLLALSCCLAGIHFDWMLMVVGVVLTLMVIVLATLEQYTVVVWVIMSLAVLAAVAYSYFKGRASDSQIANLD